MSQSITFYVSFAGEHSSAIHGAIRQVVPLLGLEPVSEIAHSQLVFTDSPAGSLTALKSGRNVIELNFDREAAETALRSHFGPRYSRVQGANQLLASVAGIIQQLPSVDLGEIGSIPLAGLRTWNEAERENKRVLVVDDSRRNRRTAEAQFAGAARLVVLDSYTEALKVLDNEGPFSLVMTDLVMPTEPHALGKKGLQQIGAP